MPFQPDGVYAGIPYRVLPDCSIEAMMPGGLVLFKNINQLLACFVTDSPRSIATQSTGELLASANHAIRSSSMQPDYYSILLETIDNTKQNSVQLRALVYERARFNLKRDVLFGHSSIGLADLVQKINDFELAVARIEANAVDDEPALAYRGHPKLTETAQQRSKAIQILPPHPVSSHPGFASIQAVQEFFRDRQHQDVWPRYMRSKQFARVAIIILASLAAVGTGATLWRLSRISPPAEVMSKLTFGPQTAAALKGGEQDRTAPVAVSASADTSYIPLPKSFGIYVLSDNRLIELQPLPIHVPDARVNVSAPIKVPSTTTLSDNNPIFILFRRDLLNNAPQKISLRVVARMARNTKIVNGKATVSDIGGTWRIRNISRDLKLSPVPDQREMIEARLGDGTSLSAGRYALVFNQVGYDFTIEGSLKSTEFCLEEFETTGGTILNQCRNP